jgi:hypothetical protein
LRKGIKPSFPEEGFKRRIEKVTSVSFQGTKLTKLSEFSLDHNDKGEEVAGESEGAKGTKLRRVSYRGFRS